MTSAPRLALDDRAFFTLVSDAAFANPFGEERPQIDRRLTRAARGADRAHVVDALLDAVRTRLARIERGKHPDLRRYAEEDRTLLEHAVLFLVFHKYAPAFDALIQSQLGSHRPARVPFARDALGDLAKHGFDAADARRYFGTFFQLRRAFYFIEHTLPGESASMRNLRQRLWSNIFTCDVRLYARALWRRMEDFSTFLLGETGTGKGTAAAAIGRSAFIPFDEKSETFATSFEAGFVSINLSQFPEPLIESELFGHKKGAFTGAVEGHVGVFERCSPHGAIFLDEIGEIGVPVQIKLLRVLQERTFSAVGGHEQHRFSGRVIAATNRSLDALRAEGKFRDDFYYRLCSDVIEVPSLQTRLREDPGELDRLVGLILRRMVGEDVADLRTLVREVVDRSLGPTYAWPGNVREVEQCVRRVILTRAYDGDRLARSKMGDGDARLLDAAADDSAEGLLARYCRALYARHGSYEEVARRTQLDRRTVKRYVALEAPEAS